jgi:hypothetical protein
MSIPTYTPRFFGRLDTWCFGGWALKVYSISTAAPDTKPALDPGFVAAAHAYVEASLARMNVTPHYAAGFVILHHGSAAKSLLTQWWTNECVCLQHVAQSAFTGPPRFAPAPQELMACVYELAVIDFERRAWVSTAMSGRPVEDYLRTWLADGFY